MAHASSVNQKPARQGKPQPEAKEVELEPKVWALRAYLTVQVIAGILLFAYFAPQIDGSPWFLAMFIVLVAVAAVQPLQIYGDSYVSIGFVLTMALIVLFGAPGAVLVAPVEAVAAGVGRKRLDYRVLTNASLFVIVGTVSALTYDLIAEVNPAEAHLEMVPAALAATAVSFGLTALLLGLTISLHSGQPFASTWEKHRWLAPHYFSFGLIGLALATAYVALGIAGIVAFMTPALMMRIAMRQYVDKTKENVEKLQDQNKALRKANMDVRQAQMELSESYDGTLEALVNALDARDQETKGHSIRVSRYMLDMAREMGVKEGSQDWIDMQRGSLLHDVGKIGVRDTILLKPGKLTDDEWQLMRKHPEIGYNMLRQVKFLEGAAGIILAHHERWDGKGYPKGLKGDGVPLGARIFMVCDTFDSMTSDRPYRRALTTQEALNEILKYSGSQFDPRVVEAFLDIYKDWVKEREAMIASQDKDSPIALPHAA